MKDTYLYFAERGIEFREHGINRVLGQKTQRGQKKFTNEELLHILQMESHQDFVSYEFLQKVKVSY